MQEQSFPRGTCLRQNDTHDALGLRNECVSPVYRHLQSTASPRVSHARRDEMIDSAIQTTVVCCENFNFPCFSLGVIIRYV